MTSPAVGTPYDAAHRLNPLELRQAFAQFPQGIVVIAAEIDGAPEGLVASTFTVGISLEPPLVSFAVQHTSQTWPLLRDAETRLGVSALGSSETELARQLASKDRSQRFDGIDYTTDDAGALLLPGVPLRMTTRIYDQFPAGDHDIVLLELLDVGANEQAQGMVFHRGAFSPLPGPQTA